MATKGVIFDIKKFAVHDGPGIRTTVFFKGCPLRCPWCHNPEGISPRPEIMVFPDRCLKGCRDCIPDCPHGALGKSRGAIVLCRSRCDGCGACARACPTEALQVTGRPVTVGQVMEEIIKDKPFYEESGGGVTFSGGEPMQQPRFLAELLLSCRKQGIRTAIDTSGNAPNAEFERLLPLAGLFLYDLKVLDDERHRRLTGVSNRLLLKNLQRLSEAGAPLALRVPVVPGVNDADNDLQALAGFCAALPNRHPVHILPYHRGYVGKARRLGLAAAMAPSPGTFMAGVLPPATATMQRAKEIFLREKLTVTIGG